MHVLKKNAAGYAPAAKRESDDFQFDGIGIARRTIDRASSEQDIVAGL